MSLRNRFVLPFALSFLAALAGCGSSSPKATPPPTGGFTNSNLSGTYAFSTVGYDVNGAFMAIAGVFAANGKGGITGGTIDINDPALGILSGEAVTGGTYNVGTDGRPASGSGLITLQTASNGAFTFDFVLSSSSGGLIAYFSTDPTSGGSGSGTFALQTAVTQSSIDGQSYAFNVGGVIYSSSTGAQSPFATAGAFTLDASGSIGTSTTGVEDVNSNASAVCGANGCPITAGSINLSAVPGTATLTSSAGTFNFDVYPVTPTQLIFIETDAAFITAGNAFTQTTMPTGYSAYSVAGLDYTASLPLTAVGVLNTGASGSVTNASTEDVNDAGNYEQETGITGSYSPLSGGRSVITLSGFVKGDGGVGCSSCQFAAYPTSGGMQLLEIDNAGVVAGVAYPQAGSPALASAQGYGVDLTGSNSSVQAGSLVGEDDIAEFTNTSGTFSGLIDFNDEGLSATFGQAFSSMYAADTTGIPGRGTVTAGNNAYDLVTYVVDGSTAVCISSDSSMIALGTLSTQTGTSTTIPNASARHLVALRASSHAMKHLKRQPSL